MSVRHRGMHDSDYYKLVQLQGKAKAAERKFFDHLDECRACSEGKWLRELCPDGQKLIDKLRDLNDELEEMDAE